MKNKLIVFCYSNHSCLNYHFWLRSARNFILVPRALSYQPGRRLPETCVVRDKGCHPIPKGRYVGEKKKKEGQAIIFKPTSKHSRTSYYKHLSKQTLLFVPKMSHFIYFLPHKIRSSQYCKQVALVFFCPNKEGSTVSGSRIKHFVECFI